MKRITAVLLLALLATGVYAQEVVHGKIEGVKHQGSYTPTYKSDGSKKAPLNVILMIGDGTGLAHWATGYFANGEELTVTNLRHLGWVTTKSAKEFTTDSAASGTAYACGQKTYNYAVGVDLEKNPIPNIPEIVSEKGIVSGIVSTDELTGATPASFFAHQPGRGMRDEIWADLPLSPAIFLSAGSWENYEKVAAKTREAIENSYTVVKSLDDPAASDASRLVVLPPHIETGYIVDGRTDFLPVTTRYAIDFLKARKNRGKGFFLMVEGARIDKASHLNVFDSEVLELLDFDKAITEAIKFADEDGHTLVVICADHETGGLSIADGNPSEGRVEGNFVTRGHTAIPIPIFAYGPHSQDFSCVQGNEEVGAKIISLLTGKK